MRFGRYTLIATDSFEVYQNETDALKCQNPVGTVKKGQEILISMIYNLEEQEANVKDSGSIIFIYDLNNPNISFGWIDASDTKILEENSNYMALTTKNVEFYESAKDCYIGINPKGVIKAGTEVLAEKAEKIDWTRKNENHIETVCKITTTNIHDPIGYAREFEIVSKTDRKYR